MALMDFPISMALKKVRDNVINPRLDGIGVVEEISWKNKSLFLRLRLEDLEEHPIEVMCNDISFAPDGSTVTVGRFTANKKFAQTALDNFVAGKSFDIPEGGARLAIVAAKKLLGM